MGTQYLAYKKPAESGGGSNGLLTDLEAYWKMDETSGTLTDEVNNYTIPDTGSFIYSQTGVSGESAIDNQGSLFQSNIDPSGFTEFSVMMWLNYNSVPANLDGFLAFDPAGGGTTLRVINGNEWNMRINGTNNIISSPTIDTSAGFHLVIVTFKENGSDLDIQISQDGGTFATTTASNIDIGTYFSLFSFCAQDGNSSSRAIDALGCAFAVWTRELTQDDVTNLYNSGSGLFYDDFD